MRAGGKKAQVLEQRYGQPLRELLINLHIKHNGSVTQVAAELGVTDTTIYHWRKDLGISPVEMEMELIRRKLAQEAPNG